MKVLWITNMLFPEAAALLSVKKEIKGGGGWLLGAAQSLTDRQSENFELYVATVSNLTKELKYLKGKTITHVIVPLGKGNIKYNSDYEKYWKEVYKTIKPDLVHIHGTEYSHGIAYVKACGGKNVVVSIQGLTSVISRYYCAGYSQLELYKNITIHDLIKGSLCQEKKRFEARGRLESELLKSVNHIVGRTWWDRAHAWAINSNAKYYFCNETLRKEFYKSITWNYEKCKKHSIFISQAYSPIKGLHQIVYALPMIQKHYSDVTLRIAGEDVLQPRFIHKTAYVKILNHFIDKNNLRDRIQFTGALNADGMIKEYLDANVYVCPSSIENSPNSLGEAQILGVPVLASYVGGVPDMMRGYEDNLYRFEEVEMLAYKICEVFGNSDNQKSMRNIALERHDAEKNGKQLYEIYKKVLKE